MAKTILVVDDNPDFLHLADLMLKNAGYQVLTAEDALKAMELLEQHIPDAIVLDIMMPVRNGFEFLENLRWEPRFEHIPVIVITAMTLNGQEREFIDTFATACLDKAQAPNLVEFVNKTLARA